MASSWGGAGGYAAGVSLCLRCSSDSGREGLDATGAKPPRAPRPLGACGRQNQGGARRSSGAGENGQRCAGSLATTVETRREEQRSKQMHR